MKILMLHADNFEYEITSKALRNPEPVTNENKKATFKEIVVAFTTIEKNDEKDINLAVKLATDAIKESCERIGVKKIVLYPYAHLSNNLASVSKAMEAVKRLASRLENEGFEVWKSPFGWYKRFKISVKGHPLAEQLRTIEL